MFHTKGITAFSHIFVLQDRTQERTMYNPETVAEGELDLGRVRERVSESERERARERE